MPTDTPTPQPSPTATQKPKRTPQPLNTLPPDADTYEEWLPLFTYDPSVPFNVEEASVKTEANGVTIHDISFDAPGLGRIKAYLVVPPGEGPFAGVIFMHYLTSEGGNREEFFEEAVELAEFGVVSILPNGHFPWTQQPATSKPEQDVNRAAAQVLEISRALDLLLTQPGVDSNRIALVGHDYGGAWGSVLAGYDRRIKTAVLLAVPPRTSQWQLDYFPESVKGNPEKEDLYRTAMLAVEPISYAGHFAPTSVFFQFADSDRYITLDAANELFAAASEPKEMKIYSVDHDNLQTEPNAKRDRLDWLKAQLELAR